MVLKYFVLALLIIANCLISDVSIAEAKKIYANIPGIVTKVYDGDTLTLQNNNGIYKIRLHGIDAPERRQAVGNVSRECLYRIVRGKFVYAIVQDRDRYGRYVAKIMVNDIDVNAEMLKAGLAWHYKKYDNNSVYASLEDSARKNKIGLWSDKNPIPPWEFRKNKAPAYSK